VDGISGGDAAEPNIKPNTTLRDNAS
jgi:hypothetical protein